MTTRSKNAFSGWLAHPDGRLKTTRITLGVFLLLLLAVSLVYKAGKSADQMLVAIDHIFEPEVQTPESSPQAVEKPVPDPKDAAEAPASPEPAPVTADTPEPAPVTTDTPEQETTGLSQRPLPEPVKTPVMPQKTADSPVEKQNPASEAPLFRPAVLSQIENALAEQAKPEKTPQEPALTSQASEPADPALKEIKVTPEPEKTAQIKPDNLIFSEGLRKLALKSTPEEIAADENGSVWLPSETYFEVFSQWHNQGKVLDDSRPLVPLRIENLEKVYELFQMKVVAVKDGVPHTDLGDGTRLAKGALADFSSTCFVVADPWNTWGKALKNAGFSRRDKVEVRYYTYDVVRDAIYARAMKAFDWTSSRIGLSRPYDPLTADVLGQVFAIQRQGGGRFGVFVPVQVDYRSGKTVKVDPMACFTGQKDVEALSQTGVL